MSDVGHAVEHAAVPSADRRPGVTRRTVLAGAAVAPGAAALGVATLALPAAAAAASPSDPAPALADGTVAGAYRRTGDVAGVASTYLVLTHTGGEGTDSVYDVVLTSSLTGVDGVIVAGGGAGGAGRGAGGGAGGVARTEEGVTLAAGTYRVTVGGGGVGARVGSNDTTWSPGGDGRASSIVAVAGGTALSDASAVGGGGGGAEGTGRTAGRAGGSGGGGGGYLGTTAGASYAGGTGTAGQGSAGAAANANRTGGGGGAGQVAGIQNTRRARQTGNTTARNADGGDGVDLTPWCEAARSLGGPEVGELDATTYHLAGGGGGFDNTTSNVNSCGLPGLGGGRGGYATLKDLLNETIQDGLAHTGGGGGGLQRFYAGGATGVDGGASGGRGGHGGSGVAMLRWPTAGNTFPTVTRVS
jgi:hypothetical protein